MAYASPGTVPPKGKYGQIPKGGVDAGTAWEEGDMAYASPGTVPQRKSAGKYPRAVWIQALPASATP